MAIQCMVTTSFPYTPPVFLYVLIFFPLNIRYELLQFLHSLRLCYIHPRCQVFDLVGLHFVHRLSSPAGCRPPRRHRAPRLPRRDPRGHGGAAAAPRRRRAGPGGGGLRGGGGDGWCPGDFGRQLLEAERTHQRNLDDGNDVYWWWQCIMWCCFFGISHVFVGLWLLVGWCSSWVENGHGGVLSFQHVVCVLFLRYFLLIRLFVDACLCRSFLIKDTLKAPMANQASCMICRTPELRLNRSSAAGDLQPSCERFPWWWVNSPNCPNCRWEATRDMFVLLLCIHFFLPKPKSQVRLWIPPWYCRCL